MEKSMHSFSYALSSYERTHLRGHTFLQQLKKKCSNMYSVSAQRNQLESQYSVFTESVLKTGHKDTLRLNVYQNSNLLKKKSDGRQKSCYLQQNAPSIQVGKVLYHLGTVRKANLPNTRQRATLKAGQSKDSSLKPAVLTLSYTVVFAGILK